MAQCDSGGGGGGRSMKTCVKELVAGEEGAGYLLGHATVQESGSLRFIFADGTGAVAFELCTSSLAESPQPLPPIGSTRVLAKSFNVIAIREPELSQSSGTGVWSSRETEYPNLRHDIYLELTSLVVLSTLPMRQTHASPIHQQQLLQRPATTAPAPLPAAPASSSRVVDVAGSVLAMSGNIRIPGGNAAPQFLVEVRLNCIPPKSIQGTSIVSDRSTVFLSIRNLPTYRNVMSIGQDIAISQAKVKFYTMRQQRCKLALLLVSTPEQLQLSHPLHSSTTSSGESHERQQAQQLISYRGTITDTSRAACGVYGLDHAYNLYLIPPPQDRRLLGLRCGAVVLLHQAHPIFAWRHHHHHRSADGVRACGGSGEDGGGVGVRVLAGFGCCFRTTVEIESFAGAQPIRQPRDGKTGTTRAMAKGQPGQSAMTTREQVWTLPSSLLYNDYAQYFSCMPLQHYAAFLDFEQHTLQTLASPRASSRLRRALFSIFKANVSPPLAAAMSRNFYREFCTHNTGCHLSQGLDPHSPDFARAWVSVQTLKDRVVRVWQPHSPDTIDIDRLSDRRLHIAQYTQAALGLTSRSLVGMLVPSLWGGWRMRSGNAQVTVLFSPHHQTHRFSRGDVVIISSFRVVVESMMSDIARHLDATKFRVLHVEPLSVALIPGLCSPQLSLDTAHPPAKSAKRGTRGQRLRVLLLHRHAARRQTGYEVDAAVVRVRDHDWDFVGMTSVLFPHNASRPLEPLFQMFDLSTDACPSDGDLGASSTWTVNSNELASPVSVDSKRLFQFLCHHPRLTAYCPLHVRACLHLQGTRNVSDAAPNADTTAASFCLITVLGEVGERELSYSRGQEEELDVLRLRLRDARSAFDRVDVYLRLSTPSDRLAGVCEGRFVVLSQLMQKVSTHGTVYLEGTGSSQAVVLGCAHTWMRRLGTQSPELWSEDTVDGDHDQSADASSGACVESKGVRMEPASDHEKEQQRSTLAAAADDSNGDPRMGTCSVTTPSAGQTRRRLSTPAQWLVTCQPLLESEGDATGRCQLQAAAHMMWQLADHGCGPETPPGRWSRQSFQELQLEAARLSTLPLQCVDCTCKLLHINKVVASVRCRRCGAVVDAMQSDGACECTGQSGGGGRSRSNTEGADERRLRVRLYAECDDGTGRVFVSARDEVALLLLHCDEPRRRELRRLCLSSGEQQYTRKDGFFTNPLLVELCEAPGVVRTVRLALSFDSIFSMNPESIQHKQHQQQQHKRQLEDGVARLHPRRLRLDCSGVQNFRLRHRAYRLLRLCVCGSQ